MSDLTATNCGCGCNDARSGWNNNNSCWWIIILLLFCGGCGGCGSTWNRSGCGDNSCWWIIILLFFFCGNNTFDLGCDNGCGCN